MTPTLTLTATALPPGEASAVRDHRQPPIRNNSMNLTIRKAKIEDAGAIAHVQVESWKTTYVGIVPDGFLASLTQEDRMRSWREQILADNISILVAEDETGMFGFVAGGEIRKKLEDYDAELYAIYLQRERQKQGAGRILCLTLASALQTKGFTSMLVWVLEQNPSVSFYERLGAVQTARKIINIGGVDLQELAFGWPSLDRLITAGDRA
jgi:ribosomal protein S18 acetylase RimI-like enzyme